MMNDDSTDRFVHWIVQTAIRENEKNVAQGDMNYRIMTSIEILFTSERKSYSHV